MLGNTKDQYGSVSKTLHWIIAPLVILMLAAGYFMDDIASQPMRQIVFNLHKLTGILILILMLVRLCWALCNPKPASPPGTSRFEHLAEWVGHSTLYGLVILQPITGWVGSVAAGHPPHIGDWLLSLPVGADRSVAKACFNLHGWIAILMIIVVTLHVLAALYHHYIRKDNVLIRMMPGRRR